MYKFKRSKGINQKKGNGPKLTNRRNHAYSACCDYHRK